MKNNNCTCGKFTEALREFKWYEYEEKGEIYILMPCLKNTELRVNHCPVCGGDVRGIQMTEKEYNSFNEKDNTQTIQKPVER